MNRIPQREYVTEEQIAAQNSPDVAEGYRKKEQARRLDSIDQVSTRVRVRKNVRLLLSCPLPVLGLGERL